MYSRKLGPRMKPYRTPALTGYSSEDLPSRTTWSHLLLRNEEIRPNIWLEIPWDISLWRRPACQILWKGLDISNATAWVTLAILSDTTVRKRAVDPEQLNHTGNQKKDHISLGDQQFYYLQVFQRLY